MKFKVGDRVKVITAKYDCNLYNQSNLTGVITNIDNSSDFPFTVLWDKSPIPHLRIDNNYQKFDLIIHNSHIIREKLGIK